MGRLIVFNECAGVKVRSLIPRLRAAGWPESTKLRGPIYTVHQEVDRGAGLGYHAYFKP